MSHLLDDLGFSVRSLLRAPGFATLVISVVAVAIGANTAVFAVIDTVLLRALPYDRPDALAEVTLSIPPSDGLPERQAFLDRASLETWGESSRTLSGLAPWKRVSHTLEVGGRAERVAGVAAAPQLFTVLGASPILGEGLSAAQRPDMGPAVVLGHAIWQRHFAGRRDAIGEWLRLDGVPHRVLGVMPARFFFPDEEIQLWTPLDAGAVGTAPSQVFQVDYLPAVARLSSGARIGEAEREVDAIVAALGGTPPDARVRLQPLSEALTASIRPALIAIWLAVGLVLIATCINLAGLLLARGAAKRRELAIRSAVGGRSGRLLQQTLIQNLILALAGGFVGVLLAAWTSRLFPALAPLGIPRLAEVDFNGRTLAFALLISALAGLLFALLPAFQAARTPAVDALRGGLAGDARRPTRLRKLLLVAQIALTMVLLVGSVLLVSSFARLMAVDPGYRPQGAIVAELDLAAADTQSAARLEPALAQLTERLTARSEIAAAGVVSHPPLTQNFAMVSLDIVGAPPQRTLAVPQRIDPGYQRATGIRLKSGRWIDEAEHSARAPVAIVNQTFVTRFLGGASVIGRRIKAGEVTLQVIGVVDDVRLLGRAQDPKPEIYLSYRTAVAALGPDPGPVALVVRANGDPEPLIPLLRSVVAEVAPGIPLVGVVEMDEQLAASTARPRFYALAVSCLAGVVLILTALGLYGLLSHEVARQTRAIGVRRAVGAPAFDVVRWVLGRTFGLVLAGAILGLICAAGASRFVSALLFEVSAVHVAGYAMALSIVLVVATVSSYFPARRATRIDPLEALRFE